MDTSSQDEVRKVIAEPNVVFVLMWAGFPIIGAAVLWALSTVVDWLSRLEWVPLGDLLDLAAGIDEPYLTIGSVVIGALLGFAVAVLGQLDSLRVTIGETHITTKRGGQTRRVATAGVAGAFHQGKDLVLLDSGGGELLREKSDIAASTLREAFVACDFTWHEEDPHRQQWRPWVDGTPDLPKGANALLRTRAKELKKFAPDATDVNAELRNVGVMVRDAKGKQHWRLRD